MLTPTDHEWIVSLRQEGYLMTEIADEVGCSERSVRAVLAMKGLRNWKRKVEYDRAQVLELWNRGLTLIQIGIELGCSSATASEVVRELQMPPRRSVRIEPEMTVTPEEDAASADSLALSPFVQRRIRELGLGMYA